MLPLSPRTNSLHKESIYTHVHLSAVPSKLIQSYTWSTHISVSYSFCPQSRYSQAKLSIHDRTLKVAAVVESLEREMELLCLTGVEDQLQADVRPTLEMLRNAGIKVQPAAVPAHLFLEILSRVLHGGGGCKRQLPLHYPSCPGSSSLHSALLQTSLWLCLSTLKTA